MQAVPGAFAIAVAILAPAATTLAQSIYYDDMWFYSGPTKPIEGRNSTCTTSAPCASYCAQGRCAHGKGQLGSDGGWEYDGDFVDGYMTGHGVMTTDSYEYKGEFSQGVPHGHGKLVCYSGRTFEGIWTHGGLNGQPARDLYEFCGE